MTPKQAYEKVCEAGHPISELEPTIAKSADYAYLYAHYVLRCPFPAGEEAISKNAYCAYWYARDVLRAPWSKGEEAISENETVAREYVLRFGHLLPQESLEKFKDTLKELVRDL